MTQSLAQTVIRGALWANLANYSGKLMVFISTVILARLLVEEDFGVAGYALVVIGLLDILKDLGVGAALIYHHEEPKVADTAFFLSLGVGLALFGLTWWAAPLVGLFFTDERAVPVTRVLALTFPLSALGNVHDMLLHKHLNFKRKFVPDFIKATSKGIIAISLALSGFGAWSLVLGQVGGTAIGVIAFWWAWPWRPSLQFEPRIARLLLSYGLKIVSVNGVGILLLNVDYLFVGRFLGAAALGVYTLAFRIPELLIKQFCGVIGRVVFPTYARLRDEPDSLKRGFLVTLRYVTMVTIPLGLGLALLAEPLVLTLFTDKWAEAIVVMPAIALYTLLRSLTFNIGDVYKAQNRPGLLTQLSLVQVVVLVPALWWAATVPASLAAIAWTQVAVALWGAVLNLTVAAWILQTSLGTVLATLRPAALGGLLMALALLGLRLLTAGFSPPLQLVAGITVGVVVYSSALWWLQREVISQAGQKLQAALARR